MKYIVKLGFTTYAFYEGEENMMFNFIRLYLDRAIFDTITESAPPEIKIITEVDDETN